MVGIGTIFLGSVAAVAFLLGAIVYQQDKTAVVNRRFFVFTLATAAWITTNALFRVASLEAHVFTIGLLSYGAAALLALYFFLFCQSLVRSKRSPILERSIVTMGLLTAALSTIPGAVGYGVTSDFTIQTNPVTLVIYGLILVSFFLSGLFLLLSTYLRSRAPRQRAALRLMLIGLLIGVLVGVTGNLVLPMLGNYSYTELGPAGALAFVIASGYAMARHGLFDIRLAVVRGVTYVLAIITLAASYYALMYIASTVLFRPNVAQPAVTPVHVSMALVLALIFQPIKHFFDQITRKIFYRHDYSSNEFFARHSRLLTLSTNLRTILHQSSELIAETLKSQQVFYVIYHDENRYLSVGTNNHPRISLNVCRELDEKLGRDATQPVYTADIVDKVLRKKMHEQGVAVILSLQRASEPVGYLFLSESQGSGYTMRDFRLLEAVSDELVIAIQNALSLQEIKELNTTLQQRIDSATKDLRSTNKQLQHLDEVKDEFISMASHQLRTPLTSVKGYLSMVLEGDVGRVKPEQRKLLEEAFTSSERMVRLIGDFLNVSRLQTGKFVVERRPIDLAKVIEQEVEGLKIVAESRALKLRYRKPATFPMIELDEGKLRQVIMNFIDNAIYYSHEHGTIDVRLRIEEGTAVLTVRDDGIGVPKAEQERLFGKFFRAENARQQRPDGTGVGLFLAKKVITAHGGSTIFSSEPGKGSTFGFRLPLATKKPPRK